MSSTVAIVPLRDGRSGKTRLATTFSADQRMRLIGSMASHVVETLLTVPEIDEVVVITRDVQFATMSLPAQDSRLRIQAQPDNVIGLNGALERGREDVRRLGAESVLVLHADLPAIARDDIVELLERDAPVVIAPDRHLTGTNALFLRLLAPGIEKFGFRFGAESFMQHLAEAARCGVSTETVIQPGTEIDLDTVSDWDLLPRGVRETMEAGMDGDLLRHSPRPSHDDRAPLSVAGR